MPLPPALLERLKRRKIIKEVGGVESGSSVVGPATKATSTSNLTRSKSPIRTHRSERHQLGLAHDEGEEEIIAEDYSDEEAAQEENQDHDRGRDATSGNQGERQSEDVCQLGKEQMRHHADEMGANSAKQSEQSRQEADDEVSDSEKKAANVNQLASASKTAISTSNPDARGSGCGAGIGTLDESVFGCPNKYNIYHECSSYCLDKFCTLQRPTPTIEQRKQLALILKTFPITNDWLVVYDPGVGSFYFWNTMTNLVSWLPPGLGAMPTFSADQMRKSMREIQTIQANEQVEKVSATNEPEEDDDDVKEDDDDAAAR